MDRIKEIINFIDESIDGMLRAPRMYCSSIDALEEHFILLHQIKCMCLRINDPLTVIRGFITKQFGTGHSSNLTLSAIVRFGFSRSYIQLPNISSETYEKEFKEMILLLSFIQKDLNNYYESKQKI